MRIRADPNVEKTQACRLQLGKGFVKIKKSSGHGTQGKKKSSVQARI